MGKIRKDKISKNSHDKKNKLELLKKRKNGEKNKGSAEEGARKYGYISAKSVITMAETAGFSGLQEDVAKKLAEDVTYRLRYIIQQCKKYMIHNRHNKLSCADINEVLRMCDAPITYGYMVEEPIQNFVYIKEADVYVLEDNFIDLPKLALNEIKVQQKSSHTTSGSWLKPEEIKQDVKCDNAEVQCNSENLRHGCKTSAQTDSQKVGSDNAGNETKIPTNLIKYYGITCNTILGHTDLKIVFQDLSTSCRILPIVPYLLNFITIALNKLGSERQIKRLLQTVEALSGNSEIDFAPYSATTRVINAMLLIVAMDKKPVKFSYGCLLRSYAARVLARVLSQWCTRDEQKVSIVKKMGKLLIDFKASPRVHYGALALLKAMGPEALTYNFNKIFKQYLTYLWGMKCNPNNSFSLHDVDMLEDVILAAAATIYRNPDVQNEVLAELDSSLFSYYGDAICSMWSVPFYNFKLSPCRYRNFSEHLSDRKHPRKLKYLNSRNKHKAEKLAVESVFDVMTKSRKKSVRIIFKFAGAIPVPEVNLKRRTLDSGYSQFVAGKKSERHVVVVGKLPRFSVTVSQFDTCLPVGSIFSIL